MSVAAGAAEEARTSVQLGLAPRVVQVRDDALRPVRWIGGQGALVGGAEFDRGAATHMADFELGAGIVKNRFGHLGIPVSYGLHYAYLYSMAQAGGTQVLVGGAYRWETFVAYYADWDDSFMYWLTTHTLAPSVAFRRTPSPGRELLFAVEIPFFGVLSRPTAYRDNKVDPLTYPSRWIGYTHRNARGMGPLNLYAPWFLARYATMWSANWGMLFSLTVAYRRTPRPRTFTLLTETVSVEVRRVF